MTYYDRLVPFLSQTQTHDGKLLLNADQVIQLIGLTNGAILEEESSGLLKGRVDLNVTNMTHFGSDTRHRWIEFYLSGETLQELLGKGLEYNGVSLYLPRNRSKLYELTNYEKMLPPERWDYTLVKLRSMPSLEKGYNRSFLEFCGFRFYPEKKEFICISHNWYLWVLRYLLKSYFGNNYSANIDSLKFSPYDPDLLDKSTLDDLIPRDKIFEFEATSYLASDAIEVSDLFDEAFSKQANERLKRHGLQLETEIHEVPGPEGQYHDSDSEDDSDPFTEEEWYNINNAWEK